MDARSSNPLDAPSLRTGAAMNEYQAAADLVMTDAMIEAQRQYLKRLDQIDSALERLMELGGSIVEADKRLQAAKEQA